MGIRKIVLLVVLIVIVSVSVSIGVFVENYSWCADHEYGVLNVDRAGTVYMAQGVSFSTDASMVPGAAIGEASQLNNITSTDNSPSCPCCPIIFIVSLFGFFGIIPGFIIVCFFVMRIANPRIYSAEANRQVVLKNIRKSKSRSFKWVEAASFSGSELMDGNDVVAMLVWPIPSISNATIGTTAEGEWVFEEGVTVSFFKPPSPQRI